MFLFLQHALPLPTPGDNNDAVAQVPGLATLEQSSMSPAAHFVRSGLNPAANLAANVSDGSLADIKGAVRQVRFSPKSGHPMRRSACPLCATTGLMQRNKLCAWSHGYSITSSAVASSVGGTVMPSMRAVWWLMTSSNLLA